MGAKRRVWFGLLLLGLAGAGVLALTAPQDETQFVSVRPPRAQSRRGAAVRSGGRTAVPASAEQPRAKAAGSRAGAPQSGARLVALAERNAGARAETGESPVAGEASRRNLFRPLVAPPKRSGLPPALMPLAPDDLGGLLPLPNPAAPGAKRRREHWRYVGTVSLDGATYALIEEQRSKAGAYVKEGDTFRGGRIAVVRPDYVVVAIGGREYRLPKATGLEEEPEEKPAAAPAPGAAVPSPPGQPAPQQSAGATPPEGAPREEAGRAPEMAPGMTGDWGGAGRRGRRARQWGGEGSQ